MGKWKLIYLKNKGNEYFRNWRRIFCQMLDMNEKYRRLPFELFDHINVFGYSSCYNFLQMNLLTLSKTLLKQMCNFKFHVLCCPISILFDSF